MTRQAIIENTIRAINLLPEAQAKEILDFADFLAKRYEERQLTEGIQKLASESHTYDFLKEDEDLYSVEDLKEKYNDQR